MIDRARQFGVKLSENNLQYKIKEVRYLGQIYTKDSASANTPSSKKELRVLVMANYIARYVSDLAEFVARLRTLIKNIVEFIWTDEHLKNSKSLWIICQFACCLIQRCLLLCSVMAIKMV